MKSRKLKSLHLYDELVAQKRLVFMSSETNSEGEDHVKKEEEKGALELKADEINALFTSESYKKGDTVDLTEKIDAVMKELPKEKQEQLQEILNKRTEKSSDDPAKEAFEEGISTLKEFENKTLHTGELIKMMNDLRFDTKELEEVKGLMERKEKRGKIAERLELKRDTVQADLDALKAQSGVLSKTWKNHKTRTMLSVAGRVIFGGGALEKAGKYVGGPALAAVAGMGLMTTGSAVALGVGATAGVLAVIASIKKVKEYTQEKRLNMGIIGLNERADYARTLADAEDEALSTRISAFRTKMTGRQTTVDGQKKQLEAEKGALEARISQTAQMLADTQLAVVGGTKASTVTSNLNSKARELDSQLAQMKKQQKALTKQIEVFGGLLEMIKNSLKVVKQPVKPSQISQRLQEFMSETPSKIEGIKGLAGKQDEENIDNAVKDLESIGDEGIRKALDGVKDESTWDTISDQVRDIVGKPNENTIPKEPDADLNLQDGTAFVIRASTTNNKHKVLRKVLQMIQQLPKEKRTHYQELVGRKIDEIEAEQKAKAIKDAEAEVQEKKDEVVNAEIQHGHIEHEIEQAGVASLAQSNERDQKKEALEEAKKELVESEEKLAQLKAQ